MLVIINGEEQQTSATTVLGLLEDLSLQVSGVAVAVNARVIPKSQLSEFLLSEGDAIEIIQAVGGG